MGQAASKIRLKGQRQLELQNCSQPEINRIHNERGVMPPYGHACHLRDQVLNVKDQKQMRTRGAGRASEYASKLESSSFRTPSVHDRVALILCFGVNREPQELSWTHVAWATWNCLPDECTCKSLVGSSV